MIDEIENKQYLRELYDSITGLLLIKGDTLEDLIPFEAINKIRSIKIE
jgi:hypothetical protein